MILDNAIFLGEHNLDAPSAPPVWVARPTPAHRSSLVPWVIAGIVAAGVVLVAAATGLVRGTSATAVSLVAGLICAGAPVLFYRNTKLFVTDQHFGCTNLFGSMKLIPRKYLASVEAGTDYRFQSEDGVTLLSAKPSVWRASQIRQVSSRLGVPFEVSVGR